MRWMAKPAECTILHRLHLCPSIQCKHFEMNSLVNWLNKLGTDTGNQQLRLAVLLYTI